MGTNHHHAPQDLSPPIMPLNFPDINTEEGRKNFRDIMDQQYTFFDGQCTDLKQQLQDVTRLVDNRNNDLVQRIERIIALMTNHMICLKQIIELVDNFGDRLHELEKSEHKRDIEFVHLAEQQNSLAQAQAQWTKSSSQIFSEIEDLKKRAANHDKFEFKVAVVGAVALAIFLWLLGGDNLVNVIQNIISAIKPN